MTDKPTPIDTSVPLDLHPEAISPHGEAFRADDAPGKMGLAHATAALAEMHDSYRKIAAAASAIQDSEHRVVATPAGLRVGRADLGPLVDAAKAAFDKTARAVDGRLRSIGEEQADLAKRLDGVLSEPTRSAAGIALATEARTYLRSLEPGKAMKVVMDAARAGDRVTAAAVLTAPPYLSGLDAARHSELRDFAAATLEPRLHASLGALERIADHVRRASQSYVAMYAKVSRAANAGPGARVQAALRELHSV